jgi:peptide/nickel transport system substrate-binding protein
VIRQIQVVDENTVDFILQRADTLFPGRLMVGIVPQTLIEMGHPFNKKPVGNGTFQFVHWPQSSQLYLKRLRDGQLFELMEIKDPMVRVLKLVRGEIDLLQNDLSLELVAWLAKQPQIKVDKGQGSNFTYLGFNLQEPVTRQLVVRQAIAYALDRHEIIHYVLGNAARPATSFVLPPTHWAGNVDLPVYSYNPTQARTLLAQIGITPDNPLTLSYKTSNNPFRIRIATVIQHQLAKVAINVDLRTYDWGTFYGDIKSGRFQLYSLSWVGIKMPDIFRYAFHSSMMPPNGANRGRLKHPTIDKLIEQAESATSLAEQAKYYRQLQVVLNQELPYVALWYEDHVSASQQAIEGYTLAADGNYDGLKTVEKILTHRFY